MNRATRSFFGILLAFCVLMGTGVVEARGLSKRSSRRPTRRRGGRPASASSSRRGLAPTRQALNASVVKGRYTPARTMANDGFIRRATRTIFKLDARGGSLPVNVGQHMARNKTNELSARRTARRWQSATNYVVKTGQAIGRLHTVLNP